MEFCLDLTVKEMEEYAALLGADCAVFIRNKPVYAEGIGNIFSPIDLSLKGWFLVLVKPDDFISTREAYSAVTPKPSEFDLRELSTQPVSQWKGSMVNDFEKSVFPQHPIVRGIRDRFYELGAEYAAMSGSGSSVFALFREKISLEGEFDEHFLFSCILAE